jgi:hypothetical protein
MTDWWRNRVTEPCQECGAEVPTGLLMCSTCYARATEKIAEKVDSFKFGLFGKYEDHSQQKIDLDQHYRKRMAEVFDRLRDRAYQEGEHIAMKPGTVELINTRRVERDGREMTQYQFRCWGQLGQYWTMSQEADDEQCAWDMMRDELKSMARACEKMVEALSLGDGNW